MNSKTIKTLLSQRRVQLAIIAVVIFLAFSNMLQNKLVWDDHILLQQWPQVRSLENVPQILQGAAPATFGRVYRPVRNVFYLIDYSLWKDNPSLYHLQALLVHIAVTVTIYLILELMLKKRLPAFLGALLFGLHPIHTEQINYISASMDNFGLMFFFISFYFYIKKDKYKGNKLSIASVFFALLAFFTFELSLTLPILMVLYDFYFKHDFKIKNLRKLIQRYLPYAVAAFTYLFLRTLMTGIISRGDYLGYSFFLTMLVMVRVFVRYIGLLFLPINLTANHRLIGDFPVSMLPYDSLNPILNQSILDSEVIFAATIIVSLIFLSVYLFKKIPILSFCIVWFFISLLPVSYIIPSGGAMAERYLYVPSFGFILAIVYLLFKLADRNQNLRNVVFVILILVSAFYFYGTFERNKVWRNDITLFTDMENKLPGNLIANFTLGVRYAEVGNLEKAISYYKKAVEKVPNMWEAHVNLARIYLKQGRNELAIGEFRKTLQYNPSFTPAINELNLLTSQPSQSGSFNDGRLNGKISYSVYPGILINYPHSFSLTKTEKGVILKDKTSDFTIILEPRVMDKGVTVSDYLNNQKVTYGTLINQGLAQIPNMDYAYVRIWILENSTQMDQFFLFSNGKVIEARVSPSNSSLMREFDGIVSAIKIE